MTADELLRVIERERERRDMPKRQLAIAAGLSASRYSDILAGRRDLTLAQLLALMRVLDMALAPRG